MKLIKQRYVVVPYIGTPIFFTQIIPRHWIPIFNEGCYVHDNNSKCTQFSIVWFQLSLKPFQLLLIFVHIGIQHNEIQITHRVRVVMTACCVVTQWVLVNITVPAKHTQSTTTKWQGPNKNVKKILKKHKQSKSKTPYQWSLSWLPRAKIRGTCWDNCPSSSNGPYK